MACGQRCTSRVGRELLSRQERFVAYGPQAVVDAWVTLVNGHAVGRDYKPPKEAEEEEEAIKALEALNVS